MKAKIHIHTEQTEWATASSYPEELQKVVRWKTLMGGESQSIPLEEVLMGVLDLEAGGYYPLHSHPSPEIYYVISGTAEWTVGEETFAATPGMAIYHASDIPHRMVNNGDDPLRTVWFWWAPDGKKDVLKEGVRLLEPMPGN